MRVLGDEPKANREEIKMETELSNCQFAGKGNDFNLTAKKRHVINTVQSLRSPVRACISRYIRFDWTQVETKRTNVRPLSFSHNSSPQILTPKKRNQKKKNIRQREKSIYTNHKCYQQTESSDLVL